MIPAKARRPLLLCLGLGMLGCTDLQPPTPPPSGLTVGADLSEALYAQDQGARFFDTGGAAKDALQLFAEQGYGMGRVRINVDPTDHPDYGMFTDVDYGARVGRALHGQGMNLLVALHYSHWWADPGNQWTPEAWRGLSVQALSEQVRTWTRDTLVALDQGGARPEAVQIGNEISNGMLWDQGGPFRPGGSWGALSQLINAGIEGAKQAAPEAKIVLHLETSGDWAKTKDWLQRFQASGGQWAQVDIIGLSYYPMWQGSLQDLEATLTGLAQDYPDKEVWLVETAYYWSPNEAGFTEAQTPWPQTPQGQRDYLRDLRAALIPYPQVTHLIYWGATWSQSAQWLNAPGWSDDDASRRSLFDDEGRPTPAFADQVKAP